MYVGFAAVVEGGLVAIYEGVVVEGGLVAMYGGVVVDDDIYVDVEGGFVFM
jgi:hypothetical protein